MEEGDALVGQLAESGAPRIVTLGQEAADVFSRITDAESVALRPDAGYGKPRSVIVAGRAENGVLTFIPRGVLWFGTAQRLDTALLDALAAHPRLLVDLSRLGRVDSTGALVLRSVLDSAKAAGLATEVQGIPRSPGSSPNACSARRLTRSVEVAARARSERASVADGRKHKKAIAC